MMEADKDALICDLAETYHIYDYRSLPLPLVAALSVGLRDDSRIKMKMSGAKYPLPTMFLAGVLDKLSIIAWMLSEDGRKGRNRPKMVLPELLDDMKENDVTAFDTPKEFEAAWKRITERGEKYGN